MTSWKGLAGGFLGLTLLDLVVSSSAAAQRTTGIFAGLSKVAQDFLDPTFPTLSPVPGNNPPAQEPTIQTPQFNPATGQSVPGTGVAPGLGTGPGGTGLGTGNAPGFQPPGGEVFA